MNRLLATVLATAVLLVPTAAIADRIANPVAIFAGLDKITGTITTFEVPISSPTINFLSCTLPMAVLPPDLCLHFL